MCFFKNSFIVSSWCIHFVGPDRASCVDLENGDVSGYLFSVTICMGSEGGLVL